MDLKEKLENLVQSALSSESHFVVDLIVSAKHGQGKVTVILDGDQGITIDDCAHVGRKLGKAMDELGLREHYTLDVTTPGVDHSLKLSRQYHKHIGRSLKVQLRDKTIETGRLVGVRDEHIDLERNEKEGKASVVKKFTFPFSEIERAFVQVSFK